MALLFFVVTHSCSKILCNSIRRVLTERKKKIALYRQGRKIKRHEESYKVHPEILERFLPSHGVMG